MPKRVELLQRINIFLLQTEEAHANNPHPHKVDYKWDYRLQVAIPLKQRADEARQLIERFHIYSQFKVSDQTDG